MFELAKTTNAGGGSTFLMLRLEDWKADCRQSAECFCEAKHADTFNALLSEIILPKEHCHAE